ncbi:MAG TPA: hypothetical protein VN695_01895 [Streptosporangiaceae bacterium]|nr:hypothetical protein [Streptosporangiaceae bacterium]
MDSVVAQTATRIVTSPALSDFIDLRFVDVGPIPDPDATPADAVRRLVRELTRHGGVAGRSYFALVIVHKSAEAVRRLLLACADDEVIAALPLDCLGIASVDDRQTDAMTADEQAAWARIVLAPKGSWQRDDLVGELLRQADQLMRDFATSHRAGLTTGQIDDLRPQDVTLASGESRCAEDEAESGSDVSAAATVPDSGSPPRDDLIVLPHTLARWDSDDLVGPPETMVAIAQRRTQPRASDQVPRRHRIPVLQRRAGQVALAATGRRVAGDTTKPRPVGVVYLVLSSDEDTGSQADWRQGRRMLLNLDSKLAEITQIAYHVRAAQVAADLTRDNFRPAGQLSRRDMRQRTEGSDLSRVLTGIDRAMTRDLAAFRRSGAAVTRPAIVFFAADAPLADLATIEAYTKLSAKATIRWVAPEKVLELLSPTFASLAGAEPIMYHQAVADEVSTALLHETRQTP